jgi:hypothetical protein
MKSGSIILNQRQKGTGHGMVPTGLQALVSRWHKAVEVDGNCGKIGSETNLPASVCVIFMIFQ